MSKKTQYKCRYYHEICSRCINWPSPEDIELGLAEDHCVEKDISAYHFEEVEIRRTGKCEKFEEFYIK